MKELVKAFVLTMFFFALIFIAIAQVVTDAQKASDEQEKKIIEFTNSCVSSGNRVEQIGNGFTTKSYLVCNPK